jgi:hypothetical protein
VIKNIIEFFKMRTQKQDEAIIKITERFAVSNDRNAQALLENSNVIGEFKSSIDKLTETVGNQIDLVRSILHPRKTSHHPREDAN